MFQYGEDLLGGELAPCIRVIPEPPANVAGIADEATVALSAGYAVNKRLSHPPSSPIVRKYFSFYDCFQL